MRFHSLDGLRAMAAVVIVLYHLGLAGAAERLTRFGFETLGRFVDGFGASGVELFFTLSGVVLLRPYLRDGRPMRVVDYFHRRIMRLWPPFLAAWLLAGCTVALVTGYPTWWESSLPVFAWTPWLSQVALVYTGPDAYNFAWWSLTIEVVFYALVPAIVMLLAGEKRPTLMPVLLVAIVVAQIAYLWGAATPLPRLALQFLCFASCFAGGVLLAAQDLSRRAAIRFLALGVAVVFVAGWTPSVNVHIGYGLVYLAVVSLALRQGSGFSRVLSKRSLVWLGERSYSLFLTHYSLIALACWSTSFLIAEKNLTYFVVSRFGALVASILVACLVFEYVEQKFARGLVTAGQWFPWQVQRLVRAESGAE